MKPYRRRVFGVRFCRVVCVATGSAFIGLGCGSGRNGGLGSAAESGDGSAVTEGTGVDTGTTGLAEGDAEGPTMPADVESSTGDDVGEPLGSRTDTLLTDGWRFLLGDTPGAEAVSFDDSTWAITGVPHTWN